MAMSPTLLRRSPTPPLVMRAHTGEALAFDHARWHAAADGEERALLAPVRGPVIDLGCGPGRIVDTLARRGVPALGVDSSPSAVALARSRGTTVLERDVFGPLPGEGRWATALLFDGTIGIGGDPARLLSRCRELMSSRGRVVVEVERPGSGWRTVTAWFERDGRRSPSFDWAVVGADAMTLLAQPAGLEVDDLTETPSGRWFAHLQAAA
ncbi:MAG: methyltransferase domain-containing protein [Acidimicrobiales bacterium]